MPSEPVAPAAENRRLHPVSLIFIVGALARSLLVPGLAVLLFASGRGNTETWIMVMFVPALIASLVRYWSYRYRLDPDELVIREGILFRNERHVPYARIQNIDLKQNPLHRMFGVAEVRIETAGGNKPEATMRVLSLGAVERMRGRVFAAPRVAETADTVGAPTISSSAGQSIADAPSAQPIADPPSGRLLHSMSLRDVILFGLISNKGMVVVAAMIGLIWQTDLTSRWANLVSRESLESYQRSLPLGDYASAILLALAALIVVLLLMRLLSVVWALFTLYGFRLHRSGDDLRAEYGLWSRVSKTLPRYRIQALSTRESFLHRRIGKVAVQIETAGSRGEAEGAGSDRLWLAPLVDRDRADSLLREALPDVDLQAIAWQPLSSNTQRRRFRLGLYLSLPIVALGVWGIGLPGLALAALLVPLALADARLYVKYTAYALVPGAVFFRSGWWVRRMSVVRFSKIQSLQVTQSPFDRRHGMASLQLDTAGATRIGHGIDISYLDSSIAARLMDRLSTEAARTDFRR